MGKNQHVVPHPQGGWQVKGAGNKRATLRTETQAEARTIAREIAINNRSELIVHEIRTYCTWQKWTYPRKEFLRERSVSAKRLKRIKTTLNE